MRRTLFLATLLLAKTAFTQTESKNITISSMKEKVEFEKGDKDHPVLVKHSVETVYLCNDFRTSTNIVEFYNDQVSIDDVDIYVNDKKSTKYFTIHQEPYSSEGIFYSDQKVMYFNLPLEKKEAPAKYDLKKPPKIPATWMNFISTASSPYSFTR